MPKPSSLQQQTFGAPLLNSCNSGSFVRVQSVYQLELQSSEGLGWVDHLQSDSLM